MRIFSYPLSSLNRRCVCLLGSGLVGASIAKNLVLKGANVEREIKIDWSSPRLGEQLNSAFTKVRIQAVSSIEVIWAAGACGFGATTKDCERAQGVFASFVAELNKLQERASIPVRLHVMSSAGGLFEGVRFVTKTSPIVPLRPYGSLKLREERLAREYLGEAAVNTYRLASVFGFADPGFRRGLVSALIENTLWRRETVITGRMSTLRDYVWADDIGRFVAARVASPIDVAAHEHLVASGRPSSIWEICHAVERVCRRKPSVRLAVPDNDADITFDPAAIAPGYQASPVGSCVQAIANRLLMGACLR